MGPLAAMCESYIRMTILEGQKSSDMMSRFGWMHVGCVKVQVVSSEIRVMVVLVQMYAAATPALAATPRARQMCTLERELVMLILAKLSTSTLAMPRMLTAMGTVQVRRVCLCQRMAELAVSPPRAASA